MNDDKQNQDRLDRLIDASAERLRTPVDVPRERMWEHIAEARQEDRDRTEERSSWKIAAHRWWPAAAAALLILGFGLGRMDWDDPDRQLAQPQPAGSGVDTTAGIDDALVADAGDQPDWGAVTNRMFLRAEALLAAFEPNKAQGPMADPVPRWAGLLLYETRVLMDSPVAAADPELAALLDDLELVLAQVAQLQKRSRTGRNDGTTQDQDDLARAHSAQDDRVWISDGLAKRATLQRLRAHLDAGSL